MTNKTNDRLSDKFLIPLLDNEGNFSTMYIDMFLDSIGFKKNRGNSASDLIIYERQGMRLEHVVVDIENLKKFERFPHMLYTKSDGQLDTEEFMEAYKLSFSLHALYNLNLRIIK